jgi:hypothetical protein
MMVKPKGVRGDFRDGIEGVEDFRVDIVGGTGGCWVSRRYVRVLEAFPRGRRS